MTDYAKMENIGEGFSKVIGLVTIDKPLSPPKYIDLTGITPAPEVGDYYDGSSFSTELPAAYTASSRYLAAEEFWFGRFTDLERGRIWAMAQEDGGGLTLSMPTRGRLKAILAFTISNTVPLDNKELKAIIEAMESNGVIDPGRAAEILA